MEGTKTTFKVIQKMVIQEGLVKHKEDAMYPKFPNFFVFSLGDIKFLDSLAFGYE
jgi:hypothetical protein